MDKPIKFYLTDTAGNKRYGDFQKAVVKGSDSVMLVFDASNNDNFEHGLNVHSETVMEY